MYKFNKFFSTIKSSYLNSNKYNNKLLSNLRIFFEREVKDFSTPTAFGTTFRNSKWLDLKKVNVQASFLKSFLYFILSIILIILVAMMFLGKTKSEKYLGFMPFFLNLELFLDLTLIQFKELFSHIIILYISVISLINSILIYLFTKYKFQLLENFLLKTPQKYTNNGKPNYLLKKPIKSSSINSPSKLYPNLTYSLISLQYALTKLNINTVNPVLKKKDYKALIYDINFINKLYFAVVSNNLKIQPISISNHKSVLSSEITYINNKFPNTTLIKYQNSASLSQILHFSNFKKNFLKFDFHLMESLNNAKEQRWLTKNSLLTEFFIKNSNAYTQSKTLLGTLFVNESLSKKNLWISSKLANLNYAESNLLINFFNKSIYPSLHLQTNLNISKLATLPQNTNNLLSLNFFENSRVFLLKKFFFTNVNWINLSQFSKIVQNLPPRQLKLDKNLPTHLYTLSLNKLSILPVSINDLATSCWEQYRTGNMNYNTVGSDYSNYINYTNNDLLSNSNIIFMLNITANFQNHTGYLNFYKLNTNYKFNTDILFL